MKRILFILCLTLVSSVIAFSQVKEGHTYEVGAGYNIFHTYLSGASTDKAYGPGVYFEYRTTDDGFRNFYDFGLQLNYKHATGKGEPWAIEGTTRPVELKYDQIGFKVLSDFNILSDRKVNPYIGIEMGLGILFVDCVDPSRVNYFFRTLGIRLGTLMFQHLHLGFDINFNSDWRANYRRSYYCNGLLMSFNVGYTF